MAVLNYVVSAASFSPISLSAFDVDPVRGFLPAEDPLTSLPSAFAPWDEAARNLPKLLMTDRIRSIIDALPPFPVDQLSGDREVRRAMQVLSYLGHAYVWGEQSTVDHIPAGLARPWYEVAKLSGRPPVLSYASYALDNWYRFDKDGPIECGNIGLLQNFLGGADEEWFILIHVDIEAKAGPAMAAIPSAMEAAAKKDDAGAVARLQIIATQLEAMYEVLSRMPEHCDPYIYYHRVRPYIHGWNNNPSLPEGLHYEGVSEYGGQGQHFRGETGAQSAIVPCLDALLGVYHEEDLLKTYLLEMRSYMPPKHRAFMEAIEAGSALRPFVESAGSRELKDVYSACVEWVERFRTKHLEYAATYIFKQAQTDASNPSAIGTGGTPFMKYLKKHRDETTTHVLR